MRKKRINTDSYHFEEELYKIYNQGEYGNAKPKDVLSKVLKNELSENQLRLVELYYFQHINMVDIAKMLDRSPSTISRTLKRARKNIEKIMQYFFN
ncbi:MAG: RNA polymerase sigma factor [Oscillospiraceae bacterium]